jgi:DNA invertase Pin-like site-specific DNA recombinase
MYWSSGLLDRLSRSLRGILEIMDRLSKANVRFRSLTEAVDTTTPAGRMMLHIVSSFRRVRTGGAP